VLAGNGSADNYSADNELKRHTLHKGARQRRSHGQLTVKTPLDCGRPCGQLCDPDFDLGHGQLTPFDGEDQILGMQLEFLEAHFLELFVFGEVGLLKQFFQTLSVPAMFGVQAVKLTAQRGTLYFVHQAPPVATQFSLSAESANFLGTFTYIAKKVE
jgi:hypothetical protein